MVSRAALRMLMAALGQAAAFPTNFSANFGDRMVLQRGPERASVYGFVESPVPTDPPAITVVRVPLWFHCMPASELSTRSSHDPFRPSWARVIHGESMWDRARCPRIASPSFPGSGASAAERGGPVAIVTAPGAEGRGSDHDDVARVRVSGALNSFVQGGQCPGTRHTAHG